MSVLKKVPKSPTLLYENLLHTTKPHSAHLPLNYTHHSAYIFQILPGLKSVKMDYTEYRAYVMRNFFPTKYMARNYLNNF